MKLLNWTKEKFNLQQINWSLLIFLLLFLNVKIWVKVAAIILISVLNRRNFARKFLFENKLLPFYLSMIFIAIINILLQVNNLTLPYLAAATVGTLFWLMAALASYLCFVYVQKNEPGKIHSTISLFFLLNALVTFVTLVKIMIETGSVNPYTYQGMYQKYFIMTGDYMRGISLDTSTTNSLLHAFAVIYFISRKKGFAALLCMAGLLLTASNFTSLLLFLIFVYLLIFSSGQDQKSLIFICLFFLFIFSKKISPQNNDYVQNTIQKILKKNTKKTLPAASNPIEITQIPDSLLNTEDKRKKFAMLYIDSVERVMRERELLAAITKTVHAESDQLKLPQVAVSEKPVMPKDDIHSKPFQRNKTETPIQKELIAFTKKEEKESEKVNLDSAETKLPGKLIAMKQTLAFFRGHPMKIITGNGIGNFSSKLAFRTTGLHIAGGYPARFVYIHNDFKDNHLAVFLNYFSKDAGLHSVIHSPNSVYNQLLGEYGICGLFAFLFFYIGFFLKNRRYLTYGIPLLLLLTGAFFIEYWFEQLSIVIVFELMLFLNMQENKKKIQVL